MNNFYCIDIENVCNHKIFFDKLPEMAFRGFGLDDTIILRSELERANLDVVEGIPFKISRAENDNIECERQKIFINRNADRIHFLGFVCWGNTSESFRVVYENGAEEIIRVPILDMNHRNKDSEHIKLWYGTNVSTPKSLMSSGERIEMISFHHSVVKLNSKENIKEIICPDNFFMHIFAITLEKEEE